MPCEDCKAKALQIMVEQMGVEDVRADKFIEQLCKYMPIVKMLWNCKHAD